MDNRNFEINYKWQKEFYKNVPNFVEGGLDHQTATNLITEYIEMAAKAPIPLAIQSLSNPQILADHGTYTGPDNIFQEFMLRFTAPLFRNLTLEGQENLPIIQSLFDKFPITVVANHSSHLDTATLCCFLRSQGNIAKEIAERLVFIAGRPVYQSDFTRLAVYATSTLLVFSQKDLEEQIGSADLMMKVNMRSFRLASKLQNEGRIVGIYPEGTRSRNGALLKFVDAIYHYVANQIIVPISLTNIDKILQPNSFMLYPAKGSISIGKPVFLGKLTDEIRDTLPKEVAIYYTDKKEGKKQFYLDTIATLIAKNLQKDRHGTYRNLYHSENEDNNTLINIPTNPDLNIVCIGHTKHSTAIACALANKNAMIHILILDDEKSKLHNIDRVDTDHYPLFKLPPNIIFTTDTECIKKANLIIQAVHPWEIEQYYTKLIPLLQNIKIPIINIRKGLTNSKEALILEDLEKNYKIDPNYLFILVGANYPDEIMERKFTAFQLAGKNKDMLSKILPIFNFSYIATTYADNPIDIIGIQWAGALKSTYAIAFGLVDAYYEKKLGGINENVMFHFAHYAFKEMIQVGISLGGKSESFYGPSGLSDFMLACFGRDTRDRNFGYQLLLSGIDLEKQAESSAVHSIADIYNIMKVDESKYPILYSLCNLVVKKDNPEIEVQKIINIMRNLN